MRVLADVTHDGRFYYFGLDGDLFELLPQS